MTSVIFAPDAEAEFLEAIKYYEECRRGLGRHFRFAIDSSIKMITDSPFMYRVIKFPFRRFLLQKFPYAIIYTIEPDHIQIIAVAHTKRKPGYWMDRANRGGNK